MARESVRIAAATMGAIGIDSIREMPWDEYGWVIEEVTKMSREGKDDGGSE